MTPGPGAVGDSPTPEDIGAGLEVALDAAGPAGKREVTAVVVTYEPDLALTDPLLETLTAQCRHVIVVDNGSTRARPALRAACERHGAELLTLPENAGIAHAQNVGIDRARELGASAVLLSDQDSLPAPDMVDRLEAGAARAATRGVPVGGVGPVSSDTRSSTEEMVYAARTWGPRRARAGQARDGLVEVAFLLASGCLVPMSVFDDVGAMRTDLFIDHVDLEWGLRARRAGYRLFAVTDARLDHELGDRLVKLPGRAQEVHVHSPARTYYLTRNTVLLIRSGLLGWRWSLGYGVWLVKYLGFNGLLVAPRGRRLRLMLRGLADGVRGRSGPLRG